MLHFDNNELDFDGEIFKTKPRKTRLIRVPAWIGFIFDLYLFTKAKLNPFKRPSPQ